MRTELVLVAVALALGVSGCKSKPDKICANLEALVRKEAPETPLDAEEKAKCATDVQQELDACENADTIAACYLDAKTLDDIPRCQAKCAKRLTKPAPRASSSAAPASQ